MNVKISIDTIKNILTKECEEIVRELVSKAWNREYIFGAKRLIIARINDIKTEDDVESFIGEFYYMSAEEWINSL